MHIVFILLIVAIVAAAALYFMKKKRENFIMKLYRPDITRVPDDEWDPASILTAVTPGPKLLVEHGDYRRFNRV
ncbi:hypothetical protein PBCV1_A536L [Paramecium bursaria Chlorella virus 1]|uniref:Uncharacterized protein n=2 Tax=Chlorovirus TaxID=181083 RepID=Q66211_PBCV1|nr:hypothetical protein PBCV1_A536L [Paramecium bursaria Chlorella virus 1]AAA66401.1 unknown protein [Paramecium bursaria Chlorella virus 1]AAC96903.1 hypothetical protein [Paramecium bursaria Chlorella virus 1]